MTTRHVYRIYIRASAEQVWQGIVDPQLTRRYFHDTAFDKPPHAGEPYRTTMSNGEPAIDGIIEECEPPRRLVQTWHVLYDSAMSEEPHSRVEWTITDSGEGMVRLDVVHGDLALSPLTWANVKDGWPVLLHSLKSLLETGEPLPDQTMNVPEVSGDPAGDWHRAQGIECHNGVWEMVAAERSPANDEELLRRAYASAYHWQRAARRTPVNEVRALYMLAKAHLIAGHADESMHYADTCMAATREQGLDDFDLAYAHESRARALGALGRTDESWAEWAAAQAVPVADPDDREIVESDFADAPGAA